MTFWAVVDALDFALVWALLILAALGALAGAGAVVLSVLAWVSTLVGRRRADRPAGWGRWSG